MQFKDGLFILKWTEYLLNPYWYWLSLISLYDVQPHFNTYGNVSASALTQRILLPESSFTEPTTSIWMQDDSSNRIALLALSLQYLSKKIYLIQLYLQ